MPPGYGAPPPPGYAPSPFGAPAQAATAPRPGGSFMGGPQAAGSDGTQFVDMNAMMQPRAAGTDGTQFVDMESLASGKPASAEGGQTAGKPKGLKLLAIGGGAVLLFFGVILIIPTPKPQGPTFPPGQDYARLKMEVEAFAYVALEHLEMKVENPEICSAISNREALNEIVVKGLKAGETRVAVKVDTNLWYILPVAVMLKEEWPPRWTDEDRLRAAEKLKAEADSLYREKDNVTENLVPAFYRYRKIIRLYDNCKFHPPAPYEESKDRAIELEHQIKESEKGLVTTFYRNFRTAQYGNARTQLEDLLILFPEDGTDQDIMAQHGNKEKHHQYFLLGQRFAEVIRSSGRGS